MRLGTCCVAGDDTVLMRTMTSRVAHDGVMTSLVDMILRDSSLRTLEQWGQPTIHFCYRYTVGLEELNDTVIYKSVWN